MGAPDSTETKTSRFRLTVSNRPAAKPRTVVIPSGDAGALRDAVQRYADARLVSGLAVIAEAA